LSLPQHGGRALRDVVATKLFRLEYADGLRANVLELNGAAGEWPPPGATRTTERPARWPRRIVPVWCRKAASMHFTWLLHGIEQMMLTGKPSGPSNERFFPPALARAARLLKENERRV